MLKVKNALDKKWQIHVVWPVGIELTTCWVNGIKPITLIDPIPASNDVRPQAANNYTYYDNGALKTDLANCKEATPAGCIPKVPCHNLLVEE